MQKIKKGDTVEVIAGKDVGERSEVTSVLPKQDRVIVANVNVAKRHRKARQAGRQQVPAQIVSFDAPMHISNVMVVCPSCNERTRVGFRFVEAKGKLRYCKKCNHEFE